MQKFVLSLFLLLALFTASAQNVGVGTSTPAPSAKLDIFSTESGVLFPRLTEAERDAISNPAQSLIIFNTTTNCLQFFIGVSWQNISCGCVIPDAPGAISGPSSVCASQSGIGFSVLPVNFATAYNWTVPGDATLVAGQGTSSISVNFGPSGGDIIVAASSSCGSSAPSEKTISITPVPAQPGAISGNTNPCLGTTETYSVANDPNVTQYNWSLPAGWTGSSTANSINVTVGSTGGTISVTPANSCGSGTARTLSVTVNTLPSAVDAGASPNPVCEGSTLNLTSSATNASSYSWSGPDGFSSGAQNPSISNIEAAASGEYTVSATNICGSATESVNVTVTPFPGAANNTTSNAEICSYSAKALTGTPASGTWSIVSGGGSISGNTYTPGAPYGAVLIRYTVAATGGCAATTSDVSFTVTADPGAANNTTSNAGICSNSTKTLTGTPAGGTWSIVTGGGNISGNTYTPAAPFGAVTIRYTIAAAGVCAATTSDVTFNVSADPGAADNTTSNAAICSYDTKTLTGTPAGGAWSIVSGGGSITGNTYTPGAPYGSILIRYTIAATGSCPATTDDVSFVVTADPGAANNTTSNAAICSYATKTLSATPSGGTWSIVTGGGNITGNTYTPGVPYGETTIRYTVAATGGCAATTSDVTFTVTADPGAASNTTSNANICSNTTKTLTGTPAGGTWSVVSGGGSISGNTYTPGAPYGSILIRYTVAATGGCPATTSDVSFTVTADPGAADNTTSNATICSYNTKTLTATPAGGAWSIVSGGGSISGNTYTPGAPYGSILIRYTVAATGSCPATTDDVSFVVTADPGAASNSTSNATICSNMTKALSGSPSGGTWSIVTGGGSIGGSTYTPGAPYGTTTVRYTIAATGGCPATTADVTFTVTANPGAASNTTSTTAICSNMTKALTGTPAGGSWSIVSGGGSISGSTYTPGSPYGAINVRYTIAATGGCPATTSDRSFTVTANPGAADNTTSTASICLSSTKALTGSPAGGTWSVVSGGGSISGTTYTPATTGTKTVRYTIAATGGCPATSEEVSFNVITAGTGTVTFNYTGGQQTWTVPQCVTSMNVDARGAQGGQGRDQAGPNHAPGYGGRRVVNGISVTEGSTVYVYVGGQGSMGSAAGGGAGGWNGGGNGNAQVQIIGSTTLYSAGGGGGGASDVRIGGNALANRVVVAAGGGGASGYLNGGLVNYGGHGGTDVGQAGNYQVNPPAQFSGQGGTQSAGGAAASGCATAQPGTLGQGGNACITGTANRGGGGGGGYFGGGGAQYGGGGGGSNYPAAATGGTSSQGTQTGNGQVIISW